jgi:hypothetical protein
LSEILALFLLGTKDDKTRPNLFQRKSFELGKPRSLTVAASPCARGPLHLTIVATSPCACIPLHRTIKHHVLSQRLPICLFIVEENARMCMVYPHRGSSKLLMIQALSSC